MAQAQPEHRTCRIAFAAAPAGRPEEFFLEITKAGAMTPHDPECWPPYGAALVGSPLELPVSSS